MSVLEQLTVQIFADGANVASMLELYARPYIRGLTTNPTLMRRAGITNYRAFAREVLSQIKDKPISFEVLTDDILGMEREALDATGVERLLLELLHLVERIDGRHPENGQVHLARPTGESHLGQDGDRAPKARQIA